MADAEVQKRLKDVPFRIQTASLKERRLVTNEIQEVLSSEGITEPVVRFICRLLATTLHRYRDSTSQSYIKRLLAYLATNHRQWTLNNFPPVLLDLSEQLKRCSPSKNTCQSGLYALCWSTVLVEKALNTPVENVDYGTLIHGQANLLEAITAFGDQKKNEKAYSMLHQAWSSCSEEHQQQWVDALLRPQPATATATAAVPLMLSALHRHAPQSQRLEEMWSSFTSALISVKSRPLACHVTACAPLLGAAGAARALLPALHKATLRSPETSVEAVGEAIRLLDDELAAQPLLLDIGKIFIGHVHSADAWTRSAALTALQALDARADALTARGLLDHALALYGGAAGARVSSEDKIALLQGVKALARSELAATASAALGRVLDAETHERTLLAAADALAHWHRRLHLPLDQPLRATLQKQLGSTRASASVRAALTRLVGAACPPAAADAAPLQDLLLQAVQRAQAQPLQPAVTSEGLCALAALVSWDAAGAGGAGGAGGAARGALTQASPAGLLRDRALHAADCDVLIQVASLCRTALGHYQLIADDANSPVYRAFILTLLSPMKPVRTAAIQNAKELLAKPDRAQMAKNLVSKLNEVLEEGKTSNSKESSPPEEKRSELTGKIIMECIYAICGYDGYSEEARERIALEALASCAHAAARGGDQRAWSRLVARLRLRPLDVVRRHAAALIATYVDNFTPGEVPSGVVSTLCQASPSALAPAALRAARAALQQPALLAVSEDEYLIYLTPEGHLYDKSVLPGHEDAGGGGGGGGAGGGNVPRESRAYSYREQLDELQLRRELHEKARQEGRLKEVPLTPKQKEAVKIQMAKESAIRQKLTELSAQSEAALGLITAVRRGACGVISRAPCELLQALLDALRSALLCERAAALLRDLRRDLLPRATPAALADDIARLTIRLNSPARPLPRDWTHEPLESACARVLAALHAHAHARPLGPTAFCYAFPMLRQALSGAEGVQLSERAQLQAVQLVAAAAAAPAHAAADALPLPLPLPDMLRLLIDLIGGQTGRVQSASTAALLDVAGCIDSVASHGCHGDDDDGDGDGAQRIEDGGDGDGIENGDGDDVTRVGFVAEVQCLLDGLQSESQTVRDASLRALLRLRRALPALLGSARHRLQLTTRLYVATFDVDEENRTLGAELWRALPTQTLDATLTQDADALRALLLRDVRAGAEPLQRAAAAALAARADDDDAVLRALLALYREHLPLVPAQLDQFGHVVVGAVDRWQARRGVALALHALAPRLTPARVPDAVQFFVSEALADRSEPVRDQMLSAAMAIVDLHGQETIGSVLPVFEQFLDRAPKSGGYDGVRQAVVLLVGSLARHLAPGDERVRPIALRLLAALGTPSQQVQEAVAACLPPLLGSPALADDIPPLVTRLLKQLCTADKYGDRKGAAYGIAAVVKGLGILALKQLDIMAKLTEAIQEKKNYKYREGALFALEQLCRALGRLFEPYVVHALPHLLLCLGDSSQYVRAAADDAAKLIMSRLSAHGVKLVLPALLNALHDDNWRTKAGSVELLGAMAYCAPKQLSGCLPSIVPRLIEVLSDSHTRVQRAGGAALEVIGSVIRNPEIQAIVPVLLAAVQEPSHKTSACLQTLLDTQFVHFIDAPSLALIMPVVERAFLDRSTDTRKMAAQIIGNMYSLTDQKDLLPYLPHIVPGLKASLLDPVPEVRSVSARALGAMVKGMGEAGFEELLPWLMQTLTSEASSVDRSGAAQGLSEVVAGLGVHQLHKLMPEIIATAERTDIAPHVKDGYIMMFIYMPGAFTDEFLPYIGHIISPILQALADENEYVRETALKAGQRIVALYADSAIALLLPELEKGLFDDNWRIRYASVQLLGDLLYRISGVSGKMSTETACEDDNFGTEHSHRAIMRALGAERRNRVLAGLYMGRSDVALMVRQAALHVWKVVVTNTPKTLREILPTLFGLLLGCLASTSYDKRQVAARTLGDLVRKLGERVLPEIVPILERGLRSERADQRQGVCIGLGEIIASTSRDSVLTFADGLVPTVRTALCDPLPEVRAAAARTFDSLHATIGAKALDDILPRMLAALRDPDPDKAEAALDGLRQMMAIKSRVVLPYLVPVLTAPPADTRALSALAAAAGPALARHLPRVLPALLAALADARDTPREARELEQCRDALLPVTDEPGVRAVLDALLEASRAPPEPRRRAAAALLCAFVGGTRAELAPFVPALLRGLLLQLADADPQLHRPAWDALGALTRALPPDAMIRHVSDVRQALRFAASDLKGDTLPGFCLPKGIAPILPLFRESILNGLPEDKENAALMLGEVIRLTSAAALQPSVVHVTGPLIRILGDRFSCSVKAAVLETLALLLAKVGVMLKQFLPQLQTTFLKALGDASRAVRMRAAAALAQLVRIHSRADPLFSEIHSGVRSADDPALRDTTLHALRCVLTAGGDKLSGPLALSVLSTLSSNAWLGHAEDPPRGPAAGCLGALLAALPPPHRAAALTHHVLAPTDDPCLQHGRAAALFVALKEAPHLVYVDPFVEKVERALLVNLGSERVPVACCGVRGVAYLAEHLLATDRPLPHNILSQFTRSMNHVSNEVKQLVARACAMLGRAEVLGAGRSEGAAELLRAMLPALVNGTKEKNTYVRANSELALRLVLRLPGDDSFHQYCLSLLEEGAREALADVMARALRGAGAGGGGGAGAGGGAAADAPRDEDLDCTLLT